MKLYFVLGGPNDLTGPIYQPESSIAALNLPGRTPFECYNASAKVRTGKVSVLFFISDFIFITRDLRGHTES